MKILIDDIQREIIITRKKTNKNTYLRVKDDLNIYITTNYFTSQKQITKLISNNLEFINKMTKKIIAKNNQEKELYYLGKKLILNKKIDVDKWLLNQAKEIFTQQLLKNYQEFPITIPFPHLTIRKMKTRWGVCNVKTKRITLNLELIKKDLKYLNYVIIHELSHLVYPNHSKDFWLLVSQTIPDYKTIRKELNNYE